MSRTNPFKKKRRAARQTLLMFGEGLGEEVFLKHLKRLYAKDSGVAITIRNGKGGGPKNVVIGAANEPGEFDKRVVIVDNDNKSDREMREALEEAAKRNIEVVEHTPCLEALLLSVLREGQNFENRTSAWCKKEFQTHYIEKKKRREISEYETIFPKSLLDRMQTGIPALNRLIAFMERP